MSENKPFKEISTDELLNYIKDADLNVTSISYSSDSIMGFVDKFGITPGNDPIKQELIYRLYKVATIEPLDPVAFHNILKCYLTRKDGDYYINNQQHKISLLALETLQTKQLDQSLVQQDYIKYNKFINYYNIKPGTDKFSLDLFNNLYIVYMRKVKKTKLSREKLNFLLMKSFKTKKTRSRWFYTNNFIDNMSLDDRKELLKLMQNGPKQTQNSQRQKEIRWLEQKSQS